MTNKAQRGVGIHIGLNRVDPSAYGGWDGSLTGCVNDAHAIEAITTGLGCSTTLLLDDQATAHAVLGAIAGAADTLESGDILILSYSGHGGQVADTDADEPDAKDETWVCYDRMVIDDELYQTWARFAPGVRIVVLSDSCHSGTVVRDLYTDIPTFAPLARQYARVGDAARGAAPSVGPLRVIPNAVLADHLRLRADLYRRIKDAAGGARASDVAASLILISGCQDNQLSADGTTNGLFTEKLLNVWAGSAFEGSYPVFHRRIVDLMPATQTPNYLFLGTTNAEFEAQKPFTVAAGAPSEPEPEPTPEPEPDPAGGPSVRGPVSVARDGEAPTFDVDTAGRGYYVFEVTSDPALFDASNAGRTPETFYATWDDADAPARLTGTTYTLSADPWDRLKVADRLYFRIGTTSAADNWDDYAVSTNDDDGADAPSLTITDGPGRAAKATVSGARREAPSPMRAS